MPFGIWLAVLDPCPRCGRRLTGGVRKQIEGERAEDGTWSFQVCWLYRCRICDVHEAGNWSG